MKQSCNKKEKTKQIFLKKKENIRTKTKNRKTLEQLETFFNT
jgi:hypothetical protein